MHFYWKTLKQAGIEFFKDDALRLSAALAYYSVFSLAPLLVICIAIAGVLFGEDAVRGQLDDQLKKSLGASGAYVVQDMVANARKSDANIWVSLGSILMLLIGAGGLFGQLQEALNIVWGVRRKSGGRILGLVKNRFLSFTMVLGTGFMLLTSMILSAVLHSMSQWIGNIASLPPEVWAILSSLVTLGIIVVLFAAIFKILPDAKVCWRHVWAGAIFTSILFVAGKSGIGWYLGREATASIYGSAGALALVLIWIYYSSIILLFGAEFTKVWAHNQGEEIQPNSDAERVASSVSFP